MNIFIKNIIVTISFIVFISGFMIINITKKDQELSFSERRKLMYFPKISQEKLLNGEWFSEYEKYSLDQFVLRDQFRSLKAMSRLYLFNQKENNNVYIINNVIYKMEYPLSEPSVYNAANQFNTLYDKYFEGMNVYYAVIPDKNYFVPEKYNYLSLDYDKMIQILNQNTRNMTYINLFDTLSISDYYRTDIHWSQEQIVPVANKLLHEMGQNEISRHYIKKEMSPFYGSYYGQSALPIPGDSLIYLTNTTLENAIVYDYETKTSSKIYNEKLFNSIDPYNLYLSGPKALLTITNPKASNQKELILFRDSFGSSIAPLLVESYSKITLVDTRYISSDVLDQYIDFNENQDVLFLYSTPILNNSFMLK